MTAAFDSEFDFGSDDFMFAADELFGDEGSSTAVEEAPAEGLFGFGMAFDKVGRGYRWGERRLFGRFLKSFRSRSFGKALREFAVQSGEFPMGDDENPSDTPIIDYWKWLIDSGKIREFMTYLVTEFLPKLFDLILKIVDALS